MPLPPPCPKCGHYNEFECEHAEENKREDAKVFWAFMTPMLLLLAILLIAGKYK